MITDAPGVPALFEVRRRDPIVEPALLAQFEAWQAQGRAVGPLNRAVLLAEARAIDNAERSTAVTGGVRVLVEALQVLRLVDDTPPPVVDELATFLMAARDGAAAQHGAG